LKGLLIKDRIEVYRNPTDKNYVFGKVELTIDQKDAIRNIMNNFKNGKLVTLIHGVTGCGKTEIYLNLVERVINKGYGAIVMVPEIALTPQTLERFKGRFGEVVAILHSRLSDGERYDEWRKIKNGDVQVVVGARSAVFAPVNNLKLIVIDEEHEYSYKSEVTPKYLTREVAEFRVKTIMGY
jgi:primosomal protein N' (replication factor Y)